MYDDFARKTARKIMNAFSVLATTFVLNITYLGNLSMLAFIVHSIIDDTTVYFNYC